ncbi:hypothetical protein [Lactobacillus sp. Sy-1]|uniref:hypothetical protein n=1 Tax=Lactobacillus sp. Sy-1 TaxID=2109645 RepID=UPI001C573EBA|nr:hypothetical protein [Lactobacillus sp. Sy-1]MBW1605044.1 hypothetical protein [Lactobacillus sp. Sy-1]
MRTANSYVLILMNDDGLISLPNSLALGTDGVNVPSYVLSAYALKARDGVIRIPLSEIGEVKTADLNEDNYIKRRLFPYRPYYASTSIEIAKFFLSKASISHRKLNYLIYLAFVDYLICNNQSKDQIKRLLFSRQIKVSAQGPNCLRKLRWIKDNHGKYQQLPPAQCDYELDSATINLLNQVWHKYQFTSASGLEKQIANTIAMNLAWYYESEIDVDSMSPNDIYQCYENEDF